MGLEPREEYLEVGNIQPPGTPNAMYSALLAQRLPRYADVPPLHSLVSEIVLGAHISDDPDQVACRDRVGVLISPTPPSVNPHLGKSASQDMKCIGAS
jgi:hypothetical protein